ncbi:hypothetical protein, partial [Nostoc sp.]|uniref:hypothetical protein n=1 Tax=Nostoc sp. TaxID=1180 RepID=UPI002FF63FA6
CRVIEEPCNGKPLSTVLKTSEFREGLAEFTLETVDPVQFEIQNPDNSKLENWKIEKLFN